MESAVTYTTLDSPLGPLTLAANAGGLCGLYFEGQKHWPADFAAWQREDGPQFDAVRHWLDRYFSGKAPGPLPSITWRSGTGFQRRVWSALQRIPPGTTHTYAGIAHDAGAPAAVRATGAAIGRNPLSIIVPCHRVVGQTGALTGFAGGLERKRWLLAHERALAEPALLFPAA